MEPAATFHATAARLLDLDPDGYGTQAEIARRLDCSRAQYRNVLTGTDSASVALLSRWAGRLGLRTVVEPDGTVRFLGTPAATAEASDEVRAAIALEHVREAARLVEGLPAVMGADHPTAEGETMVAMAAMRDLLRWLEG